jgi:hypothetical protein
LITIVLLEKLNETIQLAIIELDKFTDLQVEDLLQLGDLHDVHMFWLDEVFQMDRGKGSFSRKGEEVKEISIITPVLVGPHVLEEKGSLLESLRDLETVVAEILIMGDVLRPDPRRF